MRLHTVQTYRGTPALWSDPGYTTPSVSEPTQQLLLEDYEFAYDRVGNVTAITDWRTPADWPSSAKPVTRTFQYDDDYRLTHTEYDYGGGTDTWTSPFAAENTALPSVANEPKPSPHVDFTERVLEQTYTYDHLGNIKASADNAAGFFDRSLGTVTHGTPALGPHQLLNASNRVSAASSPRKGDLSAAYDAGGNLTDLIVRRDGACLPAGASCWQRFHYEWDELGQISRARRWDLRASGPNERDLNGDLGDPLPGRAPDVELRYAYTAGGGRVLKTAVDPASNQLHTVYIFSSLELRRTTFAGTAPDQDYVLDAATENVRLNGGVSARVVYSEEDLPGLVSGGRHLFLELSDYLGSNTFVIDHETGELVEYATYQAYGATESNYRPERWGSFREAYKFTGKEEDVEVGLGYFGARYLSLGLGTWMSPDPVTIHGLGSDPNPYAYVHGRALMAIDPDGREPVGVAIAIGFAIGAVSAAAVYTVSNWGNWQPDEFVKAAGIGGLAGGVGGGVGAVAGGATGGAFEGAVVGGASGGGAGAATAYWFGASMGNYELDWGGFGLSIAIGAGMGALSGAIGYGVDRVLRSDPVPGVKVADAPSTTFDNPKEAAAWAGSRYHDSTQIDGHEYGGAIYRRGDGKYVLGDIYRGSFNQDRVAVLDPHIASTKDLAPVGGWHTHPPTSPESEFFSQGQYLAHSPNNQPGDYAVAEMNAAMFDQPDFETYLITPDRSLRSLTASAEFDKAGTFHGKLWIPRLAPAVGGAMGSTGAPIYRIADRFRRGGYTR